MSAGAPFHDPAEDEREMQRVRTMLGAANVATIHDDLEHGVFNDTDAPYVVRILAAKEAGSAPA